MIFKIDVTEESKDVMNLVKYTKAGYEISKGNGKVFAWKTI